MQRQNMALDRIVDVQCASREKRTRFLVAETRRLLETGDQTAALDHFNQLHPAD